MTDNMMPELTLTPDDTATAAAVEVPSLTLTPEAPEVPKEEEKKIEPVEMDDKLLTDEEKEKMCDIVCEAGADYIKTSTGFSTAGATFHDVELMVKGVHGRCKVKAAGGIANLRDAEDFINLGASRLGTSRIVKAVKAMEK